MFHCQNILSPGTGPGQHAVVRKGLESRVALDSLGDITLHLAFIVDMTLARSNQNGRLV